MLGGWRKSRHEAFAGARLRRNAGAIHLRSFGGGRQPRIAGLSSRGRDPLTRPATAGESAVAGHPLPQGGEGCLITRTAHCLLPTAYCPLPTAHCLLPTAYCPLPTAHCLLPTAYCPLPTAHCLLPTAYCPLPTAHCLLPTAYCPLPTAHCLLPTAYCLLPTAYCPSPTPRPHRIAPPECLALFLSA